MSGKMMETTIILVIALTAFSTAVVAGAHFIPSYADERASSETPRQVVTPTTDSGEGTHPTAPGVVRGETASKDSVQDVKDDMQNNKNQATSAEASGNEDPARTPDSSGNVAETAAPVQSQVVEYDDDLYEDDDDYDD